MLTELSEAIIVALKANNLEAREFTYKDLIDKKINLIRPAVNVDISSATAKKVTLYTYKYILAVSLVIVFQALQDSKDGAKIRKRGVYKIVEGIANYLTLQKFGLELENPLIPVGFRNITTYDLAISGYSLYRMQFWCSYNVTLQDPEPDVVDLKKIVADYYLQPGDESYETVRAEDIIQ